MTSKRLRLIMELIFIFILPIVFILIGIDIDHTYNYDENNNVLSDSKTLNYNNVLLNVYEDPKYTYYIDNFNIWDEEWRNGLYNYNNGNFYYNANEIANTNPISVEPNKTYFFRGNGAVMYYDSDLIHISSSAKNNTTFTTPNNCYYINFYVDGTEYEYNVCINFDVAWANGNYVSYGETFYYETNDNTLVGNYFINYTPFYNVKNIIINAININDTLVFNLVIDYTILWFIMFFMWHCIYAFLDFIVHLWSPRDESERLRNRKRE